MEVPTDPLFFLSFLSKGTTNTAVILLTSCWKLCSGSTSSELWLLMGFWVLEFQHPKATPTPWHTHKVCSGAPQHLLYNPGALLLDDGAELLPYVPGNLTCCSLCVNPAKGWVTEVLPTCDIYCISSISSWFLWGTCKCKQKSTESNLSVTYETQEPQNIDLTIKKDAHHRITEW